MAIKKGLRPSIAEVGKIKIGEKGQTKTSKNGKEFPIPKRLDYFKITTTDRGTDGNYIEDEYISKQLGPKPKELRIRLPFDTVDKNFFTQYMSYVGNKKVCSGDGEKATRRGEIKVSNGKISHKDGPAHDIKCDTETCPIFKAGKCKVAGILSCFLADAKDVGGVHKFRTHGWNATASILGALEYFSENCGGILQGLPLKLVMLKKATQDHGTINYATVVIDGQQIRGLRALALEEKQNRALMNIDMKQIEDNAEKAGFFKDSDPEDMIQEEYFSDYVEEKEVAHEPVKKGSSSNDLTKKLKSEKQVIKIGTKPTKQVKKIIEKEAPKRADQQKEPEPEIEIF